MNHLKLSLLLIALIIILHLPAQSISEITSITYDRQLVDCDLYTGAVCRYENRLFTDIYGKIEEHLIAEDGSLTRISFYQTGYHNGVSAIISDDKLYKFYKMNNHLYMMIFDLQSTPMEHISTLQVPFTGTIPVMTDPDPLIPQEMGEYLILSANFSPRTAWFHKPTMTFAPTTSGRFSLFTTYNSYIIASVADQGTQGAKVVFYDFETATPSAPYGNAVYDLYYGISTSSRLKNIKMVGDHLYLLGADFIKIYDISDIDNVSLVFNLPNAIGNFTDAMIKDDLLIAYTRYLSGINAGFMVFSLADPANPISIDYDEVYSIDTMSAMHIYNDKLYFNGYHSLLVYNIDNGLHPIYNYGNDMLDYAVRGGYYVENVRSTSLFRLYSILEENAEPITIDTDLAPDAFHVGSFIIKDNLLFVGGNLTGTQSYYLDMYDLDTLERLDRVSLISISKLYSYGDYILVTIGWDNLVFSYSENGLYLHDTIRGLIKADDPQNRDCPYFVNMTEEGIEFRSKANPFIVLHTQPLPVTWEPTLMVYHVENFMGFHVYANNSFRIYTWNEGFTNFRQTATMPVPTSHDIDYFNGILSIGELYFSNKRFYAIVDGIPTQIGEMDFPKYAELVLFLPEAHKMIHWGISGGYLYDITYSVSESDVVIEPAFISLSNYPNPFNPSTVIAFSLSCAGAVNIDVYNVRGQRVRSLVSDVYGAGVHSVVWNGCGDDGRAVGSGVYFYRMVSGGVTGVKKMLLLK